MTQRCSECGCQTALGQPMQHYWGCEHDTAGKTPLLSQMGKGQQGAQIEHVLKGLGKSK